MLHQMSLTHLKAASQALVKLVRHPEETAHVFTILDALSGPSQRYLLARMRRQSPALLSEQPAILPYLRDRAHLATLPEGSLGRAYLAFLEREGISSDGLVEASQEGELGKLREQGQDAQFMLDRLRDTHDLWHVLTGYGGDVQGETALLAFTAVQARNLGAALIAGAGVLRARRFDVLQNVVLAALSAKRASWLPALEWESLLSEPLESLRARLNLSPVRPYTRLNTRWEPVSA